MNAIQNLIKVIGFSPKENTSDIFIKKYADGYSIEVDFEKKLINYGKKIKSESKTTQNFTQPENFVVLECVNRLLETGYKPENIVLEPTWKLGHQEKGRLDILVKKDNKAFLMIECKTFGKEYEKELKNLHKDGGQLFSYFQQDKNAEILMLYTSEVKGNEIVFQNEIVKIEEEYKLTATVKDFYEKWNKLTKNNGVWENPPYDFKPKALTVNKLIEIKHEDSSFIFNRFLEILRHNVVSDKPNAFNKIFNLFLCKIYDEKDKEGTDEELEFQWIEGKDDDISFQLRLTDLYKSGMENFLEKTVTDFSDEEFENQYASLFAGNDELKQKFKENVIYKLRLEKNNEFAIKEVYDEKSFKENAKVVKEIVQLLENFKIRYTKKQQYLSDFFELLLTTGLKQESGQFFTPVPVAQFVIKSLPIDTMIKEKLTIGKKDDLLPYVIDYSAGSGHFLTESMHEIQHLLMNETDVLKLKTEAKSFIESAKVRHFDWAEKYVYGIEKDYRLVKVGKVGCYLHGDGLANVIHSDGLANFKHNDYKEKLKITDKDFPLENKQFEVIVSNPPYSVSAFKSASTDYYNQNDFDLYDSLTDNSSEIETLFIERTKQLLKDGGVAGIILPSSILSNSGIYAKAREIILQYFELIGITELGSNTFMATGTNTVTLFLRRRSNYESINLKSSVERFFTTFTDVTLNGIEKPISKYVHHVWEGLSFDGYVSLVKKQPSQVAEQHETYKEYRKKLKAKNEDDFWKQLLERESEKLFYFILTYPQKVVVIKSGQKDEEKRFLGYEFSNRRGSEGIHPIQRGKSIAECTKLFDESSFENPEKASTYIYKAFQGDFDFKIHESLRKNISRHHLVDMLTFDRVEFEKTISTSVKKKIKYENIWKTEKLVLLSDISDIRKGTSITKEKTKEGNIPVIAGGQEYAYFHNESNRDGNIITISASGAYSGFVNYFGNPIFASDCNTVNSKDENQISTKLIYEFLKSIQEEIYNLQRGQAQPHVYGEDIAKIKIPLPPIAIQQKIVFEIEVLEKKESKAKEEIEKLRNGISNTLKEIEGEQKKLRDLFKYSENRINSVILTPENYIGVDNLLQDTAGKVNSNFVPNSGTSTEYKKGDILLSNIRPYLKKIWFADNDGGSSNDVLVLQKTDENINPKYVYYLLKQDDFFDYEMLKPKGIKMPRGDKQHIMDYSILVLPLSEQQKIVSEIEKIESRITALENEIAEIPKQKELILKKYL